MLRKFKLPGTEMTFIFEGQPPKTRPKLQPKQGSFGSQVDMFSCFSNADFQCQCRGSPINVPHFGPIGVRLVSGQKAALATGGEDGSEVLQEKVELCGNLGDGTP